MSRLTECLRSLHAGFYCRRPHSSASRLMTSFPSCSVRPQAKRRDTPARPTARCPSERHDQTDSPRQSPPVTESPCFIFFPPSPRSTARARPDVYQLSAPFRKPRQIVFPSPAAEESLEAGRLFPPLPLFSSPVRPLSVMWDSPPPSSREPSGGLVNFVQAIVIFGDLAYTTPRCRPPRHRSSPSPAVTPLTVEPYLEKFGLQILSS